MAFVSVLSLKGSNRSYKRPSVKFRKTASQSGGGYISSSVPLRGKRIEIQIDEEISEFRIRESDIGFSVNEAGTFSCPRRVHETVGSERIDLKLKDDGWWYGSYAKGNCK